MASTGQIWPPGTGVSTVVSQPLQIVLPNHWAGLWPYTVTTTTAITSNQLRLSRTYIPQNINQFSFEVTTGSSALVAVVVYLDGATGPGALQGSVGSIDMTAVGIRTANISLSAGWYWVGVLNQSGATANLRTAGASSPYHVGIDTLVAGGPQLPGWQWNSQPLTPPSSLGAPATKNSSPPVMYYRAV